MAWRRSGRRCSTWRRASARILRLVQRLRRTIPGRIPPPRRPPPWPRDRHSRLNRPRARLQRAAFGRTSRWYDETLHQAAQRNEVATRLHADAQLLRLWGWDGLARWADGAGDGAGTLQYKFGRAFSDDLWGLGQLAVDIGPYGLVNGIAEDLGLPFHQGGPNFNTVAKPFGQTLWAAGKLYQRYLEHDPTLAPEVLGAARTGFGKAYDRYVRPFVDDDPEAGFDHVLGDLGALGGHLAFGVVTDSVGRVAAGGLVPVVSAAADDVAEDTVFKVLKHGDMPTPRPGRQSHHGAMSAWMKAHFPKYDPDLAPAVLMPSANHHATFGIYNAWRAVTRRAMGGIFDWTKVSEADMKALSEKMFHAAGVPSVTRQEY
jgi:HNH/Endo VII superfamily toxin with a SHH signature